MGRIAVTDGLAKAAVAKLVESGHEVVEEHISTDELEGGALTDFDAILSLIHISEPTRPY